MGGLIIHDILVSQTKPSVCTPYTEHLQTYYHPVELSDLNIPSLVGASLCVPLLLLGERDQEIPLRVRDPADA